MLTPSQNRLHMSSISEVGDDLLLSHQDRLLRAMDCAEAPGTSNDLSLLERARTELPSVMEESEDTDMDARFVDPSALEDAQTFPMCPRPARSVRRIESRANLKARCNCSETLTSWTGNVVNSTISGLRIDRGASDQGPSMYVSLASTAKTLLDLSRYEAPQSRGTTDSAALELEALRLELSQARADIGELDTQLQDTKDLLKDAVEAHDQEVKYLRGLLADAKEVCLLMLGSYELLTD